MRGNSAGGAVPETRWAFFSGTHKGSLETDRFAGGLAGSGKAGSSPAVPQAGCVRSGRCFVFSGCPVSHLPGEGSSFKMK